MEAVWSGFGILLIIIGIFIVYQLSDILKNRNSTRVEIEKQRTVQEREHTRQKELELQIGGTQGTRAAQHAAGPLEFN